jgi:hypothetical protein
MQNEKCIYFANLVIYNPFAIFPVIGDNLLQVIIIFPCILLIVYVCPPISHIEFSSSNSLN